MKRYVKNAKRLISRNASDMLLVGGIASILGGSILAIKQTPKALKILEQKKEDTNTNKIKKVAPLYIPSVVITGVGIAQIICSRNITNNKIAAVATAYTVSETALKTYKDKVKTIVKPEKYEEIKREVASEKLKKDPLKDKEVIMTNNSDVLIYDNMSGRYFKSSIDNINYAVNALNKKLMSEMSISLNEFYLEIGLPTIKIGYNLGWLIDKELINIDFTSTIADSGEPCLVIDYDVTNIY